MKKMYRFTKNVTEVKREDIGRMEPGFTFNPIVSENGRSAYNEDRFYNDIESYTNLHEALMALDEHRTTIKDCGRFFEVTEYAVILQEYDEKIEEWIDNWDYSWFSKIK